MARKLVASAGLGEIFSTDDVFIDLAGRYVASGNTSSMLLQVKHILQVQVPTWAAGGSPQ